MPPIIGCRLALRAAFWITLNHLCSRLSRTAGVPRKILDMLVASSLGMYPGVSIAERLRIPLVPAHMHPFAATRTFPDMSFPPLPDWLPAVAQCTT